MVKGPAPPPAGPSSSPAIVAELSAHRPARDLRQAANRLLAQPNGSLAIRSALWVTRHPLPEAAPFRLRRPRSSPRCCSPAAPSSGRCRRRPPTKSRPSPWRISDRTGPPISARSGDQLPQPALGSAARLGHRARCPEERCRRERRRCPDRRHLWRAACSVSDRAQGLRHGAQACRPGRARRAPRRPLYPCNPRHLQAVRTAFSCERKCPHPPSRRDPGGHGWEKSDQLHQMGWPSRASRAASTSRSRCR